MLERFASILELFKTREAALRDQTFGQEELDAYAAKRSQQGREYDAVFDKRLAKRARRLGIDLENPYKNERK